MASVLFRCWACGAALLMGAACSTPDQPPGTPRLPSDVAVPAAARSSIVYRSSFDGYQSDRETNAMAWKQANDTVHTIGGWRSYAREGAGAPTGATR